MKDGRREARESRRCCATRDGEGQPVRVKLRAIYMTETPAPGPALEALRRLLGMSPRNWLAATGMTWRVPDAAFRLGCSERTVSRLARRGELPGAFKQKWFRNTGPGGKILRRVAWRIPEAGILTYRLKLADLDLGRQHARRSGRGSPDS